MPLLTLRRFAMDMALPLLYSAPLPWFTRADADATIFAAVSLYARHFAAA